LKIGVTNAFEKHNDGILIEVSNIGFIRGKLLEVRKYYHPVLAIQTIVIVWVSTE
jgi:hypothetical protein